MNIEYAPFYDKSVGWHYYRHFRGGHPEDDCVDYFQGTQDHYRRMYLDHWYYLSDRKAWKQVNGRFLAIICRDVGDVLTIYGEPILRQAKHPARETGDWISSYLAYYRHRRKYHTPIGVGKLRHMFAEGGFE